MTRAEMRTVLQKLIVEDLGIDVPETLNESDRFYEDLNLDSILVLQLVVEAERRFEVNISEEDLDPAIFQSVGVFLDLIEQQMKAASR
jgi:acyl carrier protein